MQKKKKNLHVSLKEQDMFWNGVTMISLESPYACESISLHNYLNKKVCENDSLLCDQVDVSVHTVKNSIYQMNNVYKQ